MQTFADDQCNRVVDRLTPHYLVTYDDLTPRVRSSLQHFYDRGDSESQVRVESRRVNRRGGIAPATYHCAPVHQPSMNLILNVLTNRFPAAPAQRFTATRSIASPFTGASDGKNAGNGTYPAEWREFRALCACRILVHAVKTEPAARFWRVFGWFVACFAGFPSETP